MLFAPLTSSIHSRAKMFRPSIVRVGAGQSASVWKVSLQAKRDVIVSVGNNPTKLESIISDCRKVRAIFMNSFDCAILVQFDFV